MLALEDVGSQLPVPVAMPANCCHALLSGIHLLLEPCSDFNYKCPMWAWVFVLVAGLLQ